MKRTFSILFLVVGIILAAIFFLSIGYSYGVYMTKVEARILYTSAPYYLEAIFITLVFLLPSIISLTVAYILRKRSKV